MADQSDSIGNYDFASGAILSATDQRTVSTHACATRSRRVAWRAAGAILGRGADASAAAAAATAFA